MKMSVLQILILFVCLIMQQQINGFSCAENKFSCNFISTTNYGCSLKYDRLEAFCFSNSISFSTLMNNLKIKNKTIKLLSVCIDNDLDGNLSYIDELILSLDALKDFDNLTCFKMRIKNTDITHLYNLQYNSTSFVGMANLTYFQLNVPIYGINMAEIFMPLHSLEVIDVSFTTCMGITHIFNWLSDLTILPLKEIILHSVQYIGCENYSMVLNFTKYRPQTVFHNVEYIDVSNNDLVAITAGYYRHFPNLKAFIAYNNMLIGASAIPAFYEAMLHPAMEVIDISFQGGIKAAHSNKKLQDPEYPVAFLPTIIDHNSKSVLNKMIQDLPSIIVYCINNVTSGNISALLTIPIGTCKILNCISSLLRTKWFEGIPCELVPSLFDIYDVTGECFMLVKFPVMKNLTKLNINHEMWGHGITKFSFDSVRHLCFGPNKLEKLEVAFNAETFYSFQLSQQMENLSFVGINHLKKFDMSNNALSMNLHNFCKNNKPFKFSMKYFNLSYNNVAVDENFKLCLTCATKLVMMDLSKNSLSNIPIDILEGCSSLEVLSLAKNQINSITLKLSDNINLKMIDLSNNNMSIVNSFFQRQLELMNQNNPKFILNLTGNPFSCSCDPDAIQFIGWILTSKVSFYDKEHYLCYGGKNGIQTIMTIDFGNYKNQCSNLTLILAIVITSISVVGLFSVVILLHKYRYSIRYFLFVIQQKICRKQPVSDNAPDWEYDAFVSYCAKDRFWVHDVLMTTLENIYKFQLCIHYRDFPAGGYIDEIITKKLNKSREIIFVISDNFIDTLDDQDRPWFQFELDEAKTLIKLRKKNVIVIKLGHITKVINNRSLAELMDNHIFLEWPEQEKGHKLFWAKLVSDLYEDARRLECGCCFNIKYNIGSQEINNFSENGYDERSNELQQLQLIR